MQHPTLEKWNELPDLVRRIPGAQPGTVSVQAHDDTPLRCVWARATVDCDGTQVIVVTESADIDQCIERVHAALRRLVGDSAVEDALNGDGPLDSAAEFLAAAMLERGGAVR